MRSTLRTRGTLKFPNSILHFTSLHFTSLHTCIHLFIFIAHSIDVHVNCLYRLSLLNLLILQHSPFIRLSSIHIRKNIQKKNVLPIEIDPNDSLEITCLMETSRTWPTSVVVINFYQPFHFNQDSIGYYRHIYVFGTYK